MDEAARRSKRYPSDQPLMVRCESWTAFVQHYAGDIGQGGMFIVTDEPPPILSVIDVRMQLPEGVEMALRARVVHVIEKDQVTSEHVQAGVGVEFVELDAERKRQIVQMIEFARWQGADPNASFTRTMLENAAVMGNLPKSSSLPPNPTRSTHSTSPRDDARKVTLDGVAKTQSGAPRNPSSKSTASMPAVVSTTVTKPTSDSPEAPASAPAPKPSDPAKVKILMTHFAHKRYDVCIKEAAKMIEENPGDVHALKWQAMCKARQAIAANKEADAVPHYERALQLDEGNREARDFVRNYHRDKKLNALPFGRYFVSKKK
jgi:uncharacterized protein (TIGR02266 family)